MQRYRVGELYNPNRRQWPETVQYSYRSGQHELLLFWSAPEGQEIDAIRHAPCRFGLLVIEDVIFFLYRFGAMAWSDQPFSIWLVPEAERALPELSENTETRALLQVILVDATTGIIRALRVVSLAPSFTHALHRAIHAQASRPFPGRAAYERQITRAYERYPTSDVMARDALLTEGGQ